MPKDNPNAWDTQYTSRPPTDDERQGCAAVIWTVGAVLFVLAVGAFVLFAGTIFFAQSDPELYRWVATNVPGLLQ